MADARYLELNPYRPLALTIKRDGAALDVSTAWKIYLTLAKRDDTSTLLLDHVEMTKVDGGTGGRAEYQMDETELDDSAAGEYLTQVEIAWASDGPPEAVEMDDIVVVGEHYGSHPA